MKIALEKLLHFYLTVAFFYYHVKTYTWKEFNVQPFHGALGCML